MFSHLKFFKEKKEHIRHEFYRLSDYVEYPARQTIFR